MQLIACLSAIALMLSGSVALAQVPPSETERAAYVGLHEAAWRGDVAAIARLLSQGEDPERRDRMGRTALHVAAFGAQYEAALALAKGGADPNALEGQRYDIVTIAAVMDDVKMLKLALSLGARAGATTSPYDGTALIAAAHLGHDEVVRTLLAAGAPHAHVNNLGWTALIEAVILGNGGPRHHATVRHLLAAGADPNQPDRAGTTPLRHAERMGFRDIADTLRTAGGK